MRFIPEPFSLHRLSRFHRWAMLLLKWVSAFLDEATLLAPLSKPAQTIAHQWLDRIERGVVAIVMLRAAPHVRWIKPRKGIPRRADASLTRAVIGSAIRRSLRSRDLHRRIEALSQDIEPLVALLLKRLPRGLTRRDPIAAELEFAVVHLDAAISAPALSADTS